MTFKSVKYILGLLLAFQFGPQCFAQNSIFAKFDGLSCQGATDANFPNFSSVFSLSIGGSNTGTIGAVGGVGKAIWDPIKLVKTLDDCTPLLFSILAQGTFVNTVTIDIVTPATATTPATKLLEIVLTTVLITGDSFAEAAGGKPSEVVSLDWTKMTITHIPTSTGFCFDRISGKVC